MVKFMSIHCSRVIWDAIALIMPSLWCDGSQLASPPATDLELKSTRVYSTAAKVRLGYKGYKDKYNFDSLVPTNFGQLKNIYVLYIGYAICNFMHYVGYAIYPIPCWSSFLGLLQMALQNHNYHFRQYCNMLISFLDCLDFIVIKISKLCKLPKWHIVSHVSAYDGVGCRFPGIIPIKTFTAYPFAPVSQGNSLCQVRLHLVRFLTPFDIDELYVDNEARTASFYRQNL